MTIRLLRQLVTLVFFLTLAAFVGTRVYTATQLDRTPPVLTCDSQVVEVGVDYTDADLLAGVTAVDDRDGDISASVLVKGVSRLITADTARVTYLAIDSADNLATLTRTVRYTDYEKPRFSLSQPLIFRAGGQVRVLSRLKASDLVDGDLSSAIRVTGQNVDTFLPGEYEITVQVTNSLGDTDTVKLKLIITDSTEPLKLALSEYIVYLDRGQRFDASQYILADNPRAVRTEGAVNTAAEGMYFVSYTYGSDTVWQTVVVS